MKEKKIIKIYFSDFFPGFDFYNNSIINLLKDYYELEINPEPDYLFFSSWGNDNFRFSCVKIFYTSENDHPNFFLCDYAIAHDFINKDNYLRLPYYATIWNYNPSELLLPIYLKIINNTYKSKFCCFIVSNDRAQYRINFFNKLSKYKKVDSGGKTLNNIGYLVTDKIKFMKSYKFCICFENSSYPGYVTEKIWDCFYANCIPIYWGSTCIDKDFNPKRILNRLDYNSDEELIQKIIFLNENHNEYIKFISQPIFTDNKINLWLDKSRIIDFYNTIFAVNHSKLTKFKMFIGKIIWYYKQVRRKSIKKLNIDTNNPW